jgi:cytochrome oxidase Cu insertion factor (SCO1/SenC/PrrC family)
LKYSRDVVDFTVTDSDGERWTLYDLLDDGKTVIIDFFQST